MHEIRYKLLSAYLWPRAPHVWQVQDHINMVRSWDSLSLSLNLWEWSAFESSPDRGPQDICMDLLSNKKGLGGAECSCVTKRQKKRSHPVVRARRLPLESVWLTTQGQGIARMSQHMLHEQRQRQKTRFHTPPTPTSDSYATSLNIKTLRKRRTPWLEVFYFHHLR